MRAEPTAPHDETTVAAEVAEPYTRSMSPELLDLTTLRYEDRQLRVVPADEDRKAMVRYVQLLDVHV